MNRKSYDTKKLVLLALLTAIVIVLQVLASVVPVRPFTLNLVLIPIVIGAAIIGTLAGMWLGVVFGAVVLFSDPTVPLFLGFNAFSTVFVILIRGALAGFLTGITYKLLQRKSRNVSVIAAAAVCPFLNTGIFIAGLYIFFTPLFGDYAAVTTIVTTVVLINFPIEFAVNLVFSSALVRLLQHFQKHNHMTRS